MITDRPEWDPARYSLFHQSRVPPPRLYRNWNCRDPLRKFLLAVSAGIEITSPPVQGIPIERVGVQLIAFTAQLATSPTPMQSLGPPHYPSAPSNHVCVSRINGSAAQANSTARAVFFVRIERHFPKIKLYASTFPNLDTLEIGTAPGISFSFASQQRRYCNLKIFSLFIITTPILAHHRCSWQVELRHLDVAAVPEFCNK